jgi:hypothetical protein
MLVLGILLAVVVPITFFVITIPLKFGLKRVKNLQSRIIGRQEARLADYKAKREALEEEIAYLREQREIDNDVLKDKELALQDVAADVFARQLNTTVRIGVLKTGRVLISFVIRLIGFLRGMMILTGVMVGLISLGALVAVIAVIITMDSSSSSGDAGPATETSSKSSSSKDSSGAAIGGNKPLDEKVLKWKPMVEEEAKKQGMEKYVNIILAIIQVESGGNPNPGNGNGLMQVEASHGDTPQVNIQKGIAHLKGNIESGKALGLDLPSSVFQYNFGGLWGQYIKERGGKYSIEHARSYAKMLSERNGGGGRSYPYITPISKKFNSEYLFWNGGNYYYIENLREYVKI